MSIYQQMFKILCGLSVLLGIVAQSSLPNPVQQAYIKASNTDSIDFFGGAVAISSDGNILAVGAIGESSAATGVNGNESNNNKATAGAVYLFVRSGDTWVQQAYLKASNTDAGDYFGASLALSSDGTTLAVGAFGEDANPQAVDGQNNNVFFSSGAVYVFTRTGSTWTQQAYLKASNGNTGDQFGYSLALSDNGDTLAVGAYGEESNAIGVNPSGLPFPTPTGQYNNSESYAGAAYVFTRDAGAWSQKAYIKPSNTDGQDFFGYELSLSGDGRTLAVGAYGEDSNAVGINDLANQADNSRLDSGAVYLFTLTGNTWAQQAYLKASQPDNDDGFGRSITLANDGNTLAVGAFFEDSNAAGINGDQGDNSAPNAGAAYVFTRNNNTWTQQAYLKASNAEPFDEFGYALSLSAKGDTLAIGALRENSGATGINGDQQSNNVQMAGAVYLFMHTGGVWLQQDYIKASNTGITDLFGSALALSDDGGTLVVGAKWEDSATNGINSTPDDAYPDSGAAYLFVSSGYNVGGVLTGLSAGESITVQNNGGDDVTLTNDGQFTFATPVASGSPYAVTITTKPASKTCHVNHANGLIASSSITNIAVHCWLPGRIFSDSFE